MGFSAHTGGTTRVWLRPALNPRPPQSKGSSQGAWGWQRQKPVPPLDPRGLRDPYHTHCDWGVVLHPGLPPLRQCLAWGSSPRPSICGLAPGPPHPHKGTQSHSRGTTHPAWGLPCQAPASPCQGPAPMFMALDFASSSRSHPCFCPCSSNGQRLLPPSAGPAVAGPSSTDLPFMVATLLWPGWCLSGCNDGRVRGLSTSQHL